MKKIIIGIAALGAMSFTSNQLYYSTQLVYAMNNIEDMKEWIIQDVENNKIDSVYAEFYFETLDETHGFINDFFEHQCK
tara:strand:- start:600 stop:836 length:237 start_codon:yes stop_codon:yes gene_type:complete